jgi:hypothetical protein
VRGMGLHGVHGRGSGGMGVVGTSSGETGVYGHSDQWTGVVGSTHNTRTNYAGYFWGPVGVKGNFTVWGKKSAAVPFPDGSHRLMYAVESPESWFEDFGRARLVRGVARVRIDRGFAAVISGNDYSVFITLEGDCCGVYVSRRSKDTFEVRELQGGRSSVRFAYRIVARRKDVKPDRFERVKLPRRPPPIEELVKGERKSARRAVRRKKTISR